MGGGTQQYSDRKAQEAVEFLQYTLELVLASFPFETPDDVKASVELNEDRGTVVGDLLVPLVHGAGQSGIDVSASNYSEIFQVNVFYELSVAESERHLAVRRSKYELRVVTRPGLRFEYERGNTSAPAAHIHYSGVAGLLSVATMKNFSGKKAKQRSGNLEDLHLPVGGLRFRPSLEEFLWFVIKECGFRGKPGWEKNLLQSRESWLDKQLAAAVRDHPGIAASTLVELGYGITPPSEGEPVNRRQDVW